MSKYRKIQFSISKPCSEDWDKMTVDERGKFCNHCNKTVIDFSNYTDRELVDFFSKAKEKVCGNFYPTQLNRLIAIQEPSNTPFFHKVLIGASLAAGVATSVSGQNSPVTYKNVEQTQPQNKAESNTVHDTLGGDTMHYISGVVIDTNGAPIYFASIILHGNYKLIRSVHSSIDGHFSIKIDSSLLGSSVDLIVEANDHTNIIVKISTDKLPVTNIKLVMSPGPAQINTIRGDAVAYIIDDRHIKSATDTTLRQSPDDFKKEMIDKHMGTPASAEGSSTPH